MRYRKRNDIIDFFGVSILIPVRIELNDFKWVFAKNTPFFEQNGIELVLLLNESYDSSLPDFIETYPFINFKILMYQERNVETYGKIINGGIHQASHDHVLVLDSGFELKTDIIYRLRYILKYYPDTFVTGNLATFNRENFTEKCEQSSVLSSLSTIIMVKKQDLLDIKGFDEKLDDYNDICKQLFRRLELKGLSKMRLIDAVAISTLDNEDQRCNLKSIKHLKYVLYPKKAVLNTKDWEQNIGNAIWDSEAHKSHNGLVRYLSQFQEFDIRKDGVCNNDYQIVALIQVKNEIKNIPEILSHLEPYCDGIILLDDGSSDGSYEKAVHEKLLIKAQKEHDGVFDDLGNRNILLRLASFIKSEWFFFIDADERFDCRYDDLRFHANNKEMDVYRFQLVDLWDNPNDYRVDMPDNRYNGIATRARMFRSKGNLQIHTNREIHFPAVPYTKKVSVAQLLLLHYGNYDKEIRERKYKLYTSQDPDGKKQAHSYDFLKDEKVVLKDIREIILPKMHNPLVGYGSISQNKELQTNA